MTQFVPPNGFGVISRAAGSGCHLPSTTNKYAWRPGGSFNSPRHSPPGEYFKGMALVCQLLNEPATKTCFAPGATILKGIPLLFAAPAGLLTATGSFRGATR